MTFELIDLKLSLNTSFGKAKQLTNLFKQPMNDVEDTLGDGFKHAQYLVAQVHIKISK